MSITHPKSAAENPHPAKQDRRLKWAGLMLVLLLLLAMGLLFSMRYGTKQVAVTPSVEAPQERLPQATPEPATLPVPVLQKAPPQIASSEKAVMKQVALPEVEPVMGPSRDVDEPQAETRVPAVSTEIPSSMLPQADLEEDKGEPHSPFEAKPALTGYVKIGANGERLPDSARSWSCVEDLATGLVWEVKSAERGLHNTDNLYSWYEPGVKGKVDGIANGGRCEGTACDTHAYTQALRQKNYCGYGDWRLPSREEFLSLVSMGEAAGAATIDRVYFPYALPSWYWTATSHEQHPEYAWYLLFRNGVTLSDMKARPKHLRLVRSNAAG